MKLNLEITSAYKRSSKEIFRRLGVPPPIYSDPRLIPEKVGEKYSANEVR
jgi:hypothetical protein